MKAIVDLCVVPLGVGVSVSEYVAACEAWYASSVGGHPETPPMS